MTFRLLACNILNSISTFLMTKNAINVTMADYILQKHFEPTPPSPQVPWVKVKHRGP